jgi:hypothetical protein
LDAGIFGFFEVYGVCTADFENSAAPDGIWLTLRQRKLVELPQYFIILTALSDGPYAVLDTRFSYEPDQCPVKAWQGIELDSLAGDFGSFLLQQVAFVARTKKRLSY